ncbi:hypothetical protein LCGC14_1349060 [marine sediment metagenome]|uniref:Uncharacterized protein n=1 Tax=marine sediment metagenome TaxID=412755 RepID=A0A0F9KXF4_9ZZZZ
MSDQFMSFIEGILIGVATTVSIIAIAGGL